MSLLHVVLKQQQQLGHRGEGDSELSCCEVRSAGSAWCCPRSQLSHVSLWLGPPPSNLGVPHPMPRDKQKLRPLISILSPRSSRLVTATSLPPAKGSGSVTGKVREGEEGWLWLLLTQVRAEVLAAASAQVLGLSVLLGSFTLRGSNGGSSLWSSAHCLPHPDVQVVVVVLTPHVEETLFFHYIFLPTLSWISWPLVHGYFWALYSVQLIYTFAFVSVPCYFDY